MKFQPEHYASLKNAIGAFLKSENLTVNEVKNKFKEKGLSDTRCAWDIYWACKWANDNREINDAYNDSHIETAIKSALKELSN